MTRPRATGRRRVGRDRPVFRGKRDERLHSKHRARPAEPARAERRVRHGEELGRHWIPASGKDTRTRAGTRRSWSARESSLPSRTSTRTRWLTRRRALGERYRSVLRINAFAMGWHAESRDHNSNSALEMLGPAGHAAPRLRRVPGDIPPRAGPPSGPSQGGAEKCAGLRPIGQLRRHRSRRRAKRLGEAGTDSRGKKGLRRCRHRHLVPPGGRAGHPGPDAPRHGQDPRLTSPGGRGAHRTQSADPVPSHAPRLPVDGRAPGHGIRVPQHLARPDLVLAPQPEQVPRFAAPGGGRPAGRITDDDRRGCMARGRDVRRDHSRAGAGG